MHMCFAGGREGQYRIVTGRPELCAKAVITGEDVISRLFTNRGKLVALPGETQNMPTDDTDGSASATCTFTDDELDLPSSLFSEDPATVGCSRPVWAGVDSHRCVWHAAHPAKPPDELAATVADSTLLGARARETDLRDVPFPREAALHKADFSGANLREADLSAADLIQADLSGAELYDADLSRANLVEADLSGADLRLADLSGAGLVEADLIDVVLSRGTQLEQFKIDQVESRVRDARNIEEGERLDPEAWDGIARMYHTLRVACSANGLVGRARTFRVRERAARRQEAFATGDWQGSLAGIGSLLSRWLTGYGVRLRTVVGVMVGLYLASTAVYYTYPPITDEFYYSIVTFTTAPLGVPPIAVLPKLVAMIETFAGTALIVLLGYVLGNREQV